MISEYNNNLHADKLRFIIQFLVLSMLIIYPKLPDEGINKDPEGLRTRHEGAS